MKKRPTQEPPEAVSELKKQITAWRNGRTAAERIPGSLWAEATRLGRKYGVSLVSRHLKLDFYGLKRRVHGGEDSGKENSGRFFEVRCMDVHPPGPLFGHYEVEMEIHKRDEAMVRIRQSGPSGIDVGDIVERVLNS
jgi:hypothetical protein